MILIFNLGPKTPGNEKRVIRPGSMAWKNQFVVCLFSFFPGVLEPSFSNQWNVYLS